MENKDLFGFTPSIMYLCVMGILELLKRRDELSDIASIMYGDSYTTHDDFWDSPIENEMSEVEISLFDLGWEPEDLSPEVYEASIIVLQDLIEKGKA
jgi:hypothetical protein